MANYILFDAPPYKTFVDAVSQESKMQWDVLYLDGRASVNRYRRIWNYFIFPLKFILCHKNIQYVIAWQQFYGLMSAFFNKYYPFHKEMRITVMTFIYKPKKKISGYIYKWFVNKAITSSYIENIITFSKEEVNYYSKIFPEATHKFKFIPIGMDKIIFPNVERDEYIFTAGMSNRDYDFLCEAIGNTNYHLKIACSDLVLRNKYNNIEILSNCHDNAMLKVLKGCKVVIIPLKNRNISSGQLMLLTAMQAEKPVIITKSNALFDYVVHGKTAFFFNNDKEELLSYLHLLYENDVLYKSMVKEAKIKVEKEFSIKGLGINVAKTVLNKTK